MGWDYTDNICIINTYFSTIETNNIGVVIDGNAKHGDIKNKLTYLIETPEFRQSIGMNGYLYSKNNFDAVEIRKNFMNKINNI